MHVHRILRTYYSISGTLDLAAYYIIELDGNIIVPECGSDAVNFP